MSSTVLVLGASGTLRNKGIENSAHHRATLAKDARVAAAASASPNQPGLSTMTTLTTNSKPAVGSCTLI